LKIFQGLPPLAFSSFPRSGLFWAFPSSDFKFCFSEINKPPFRSLHFRYPPSDLILRIPPPPFLRQSFPFRMIWPFFPPFRAQPSLFFFFSRGPCSSRLFFYIGCPIFSLAFKTPQVLKSFFLFFSDFPYLFSDIFFPYVPRTSPFCSSRLTPPRPTAPFSFKKPPRFYGFPPRFSLPLSPPGCFFILVSPFSNFEKSSWRLHPLLAIFLLFSAGHVCLCLLRRLFFFSFREPLLTFSLFPPPGDVSDGFFLGMPVSLTLSFSASPLILGTFFSPLRLRGLLEKGPLPRDGLSTFPHQKRFFSGRHFFPNGFFLL